MLLDREPEPVRDVVLPPLDAAVHELLDPAAVHADDMVVVRALVQLEDRGAALEVMALDELGRLELREHPVDRRKPDVLALLDQSAVNILRRQVASVGTRQDLEDLYARQRDREPGFAQVPGFDRDAPAASRGDYAMMRAIILQDPR